MSFSKRNINVTSRTVIFTLVAMLITLFIAPQFSAHAESYGAFYVEANLPDNQYDPNVGYFDLMMEPNMKQTISFDVINQGDQPMRASINFQNGTTTLNAEKSYIHEETPDVSMKHPMTTMAVLRTQEVIIPANQRSTIAIDVTAPSVAFDGVSVGGFSVTADTIETHADTSKKAKGEIQIESRTTYLIALQIRMNETKVEKNLNYIKSGAEVVDLKPQFVSTLQNDRAVVMNDISINGTVTPEGSDQPIARIQKQVGGILPNTQFPIAYPVQSQKLEPGTYVINLEIKSGEEVWHWQEVHTVEPDTADAVNDGSVIAKQTNWMLVLVVGLLLIIVILLVVILYMGYRQQRERRNA